MSLIGTLIQFVTGTKIVAAEVNQNFEDVKTAHNELQGNFINYTVTSNKTSNYTLAATDNGSTILVTSASEVTITVPDTLVAGFSCLVAQMGAGQVAFAGSGSMVVSNRQSFTKTAGQYAGASVVVNATNSALLLGDCA